jgi:hypothetical protein
MDSGHVAFTLYIGAVLFCLFKFVSHKINRAAEQKQLSREHGCQPMRVKYPHKDPILGIDLFIRNVKAVSEHKFLQTVTRRHEEVGETYQLNMMGTVGT